MSDVRLFRRRKNGRPAGPWIAWGYDAAGQRWSETTKQIDRKAAEEVARGLERDHASPGAAAAREATLADAVKLLLTNRKGLAKAGKRSESTVQFYEFKTGHWRRLLGDGFLLSRLSAAVVDKVIESRREEEASEHTIAKELVALRCALKLAVRAGIWHGNPAAVLPVLFATEYTPRTRTVPRAELQVLFTELDPNPAAMVAFMVATGARWSEAESVLAADVHKEGLVHLAGTKTTAADRIVPVLHPEALELLQYAIEHAVPGEGGRMFAEWKSPNNALRRACERAKIDHTSFNDLRRTFATWLREEGVSAELIAPAMGHTTTAMVQKVYGRLTPAALRNLLATALGIASESAAASAANVQQTDADQADSADGSDTVEMQKARKTGPSAVGHLGLEPRANGLRVHPPTRAKVLWPSPKRPRGARDAADMQQRSTKRGAP